MQLIYMKGQNKVALSLVFGAVIIAAALYFGLTKPKTIKAPETEKEVQSETATSTTNPTPKTVQPTVTPMPEISWTKSDMITALSAKTGIPEAEVVFSTGETVNYGNTKLIRGTVQRQGEMSGAGFFAVADTSGVTVTFVGQGVPECSEVNPYGYPTSWADYCMSGGNTVQR